GGARPGRHGRHPGLARQARHRVGGEDGGGFVADVHHPDPQALGAHQDGGDVAAAEGEEEAHPLADEGPGDEVAAVRRRGLRHGRVSSTCRSGTRQVKRPENTASPARSTSTATSRLRPAVSSSRASAVTRSPTATGRWKRTSALPSTTVGRLTASMAAWSARPKTKPP